MKSPENSTKVTHPIDRFDAALDMLLVASIALRAKGHLAGDEEREVIYGVIDRSIMDLGSLRPAIDDLPAVAV